MALNFFQQTHKTLARLLMVVALTGIIGAYLTGVSKGLDARLTYGVLNDLWAMTIAISNSVYGLNQGYIGYYDVQEALRKWIAPEGLYVLGENHKMLTSNREAIEAALQAAISLDPKTLPVYYKSFRHPFVLNWGEETGYSDFYQLAFFFFGYHATSMYHLYFLILVTSAGIFAWHYRQDVGALAVLAAMSMGFWALFYLEIFWIGVPSVNGNRFLCTLGLIPSLHILLLISQQRLSASRGALMSMGLQALILAFVIAARSSAKWQAMLIMLWAATPLLWLIIRHRPRLKECHHFLWARRRGTVAFLAVFLAISYGYSSNRMALHNPVYFGNCVLPTHFTWHSAYLGLNVHPDWMKTIPPEAGTTIGGDGMGWTVGEAYYHKKYPDRPYLCEKLGYYPARIHDKMMRTALFDFIAKNPRYAWELYSWYKPEKTVNMVQKQLSLIPRWWLLFVASASAASVVAGLFCHASLRKVAGQGAIICGVLSSMLAMSNLPHLFAYPSYPSETVWLCLVLGTILPMWLCMLVGAVLGKTACLTYCVLKK